MKQILPLVVCCLFFSQPLWADSTPPVKEEGVIILEGVPLHPAANIAFSTIQWVTNHEGFVTDTAGNRTDFPNEAVGQIIYYDPDYYDQIDRRGDWFAARFGIKKYEMIVDALNLTHLTKDDLKKIQSQIEDLQRVVANHPDSATLLQPKITQLQDAITKLSSGEVLLNGKWMTSEEANSQATPTIGSGKQLVTFTTVDGRSFNNVTANATDTGLNVITSDGGVFIPFDQLPPEIQKKYGYKPLPTENRIATQAVAPSETLDQQCAKFLQTQVDLSLTATSLKNYPTYTSMLVNVTPRPLNMFKRSDSTIEVYSIAAGEIVRPQGISNDCFIIPIKAREKFTYTVGVTKDALGFDHPQTRDEEQTIDGTGLIKIADTSFASIAEAQEVTASLNQDLIVRRFITTSPVICPLFFNGNRVGQETLPSGSILNISSEQGNQVYAYKDDPNCMFPIATTSTNWTDRFAQIKSVRKMYGFINRLNEILSDSDTQMLYDYNSKKRFKIFNSQGSYWAFNPDDLSGDRPSIYDQSETSQQDICLLYSHIRVVGYADNDSAFVAGERTDAAAASHTKTTRTVYFVTVNTKNNEDTLDTSENGEIQRRQLIFRIADRADANELADLFYDFCNYFAPSDNVPTAQVSLPPSDTQTNLTTVVSNC